VILPFPHAERPNPCSHGKGMTKSEIDGRRCQTRNSSVALKRGEPPPGRSPIRGSFTLSGCDGTRDLSFSVRVVMITLELVEPLRAVIGRKNFGGSLQRLGHSKRSNLEHFHENATSVSIEASRFFTSAGCDMSPFRPVQEAEKSGLLLLGFCQGLLSRKDLKQYSAW